MNVTREEIAALNGECAVCHDAGVVLTYGYLDDGRLTARCEEHAAAIKEACGMSVPATPEQERIFSELRRGGIDPTKLNSLRAVDPNRPDDDRDWFTAHPTRSHRLRDPLPLDALLADRDSFEIGPGTQVLVRQVRPGYRARRFVRTPTMLPTRDADLELALHALWDVVTESYRRGATPNADISEDWLRVCRERLALRGRA